MSRFRHSNNRRQHNQDGADFIRSFHFIKVSCGRNFATATAVANADVKFFSEVWKVYAKTEWSEKLFYINML